MFDHVQPPLPGTTGFAASPPHRPLRLAPFTLAALSPSLTRLAAAPSGGPMLVQLDRTDTPHVTALDGALPADLLLGATVEDHVDALAVIEPTDGRTVVSVVYRNGTSLRATAGLQPAAAPVVTLYATADRSVDAMRRALGVVTPLPIDGTAWYWLMFWFEELRACPAASIDVLEAARWHPGIEPDEIHDHDDPLEVVDFCLDRLYEHARASGWDELRASAIAGHPTMGDCAPDLASWFDTGSFSRELAHRLGSPTITLQELAASSVPLEPEACAMLAQMIEGLRRTRARHMSPVQGHALLR